MFSHLAVLLGSLLLGMAEELPDLPPLISLLSDEDLDAVSTGNESFLDCMLSAAEFFDSDRFVVFCSFLCRIYETTRKRLCTCLR